MAEVAVALLAAAEVVVALLAVAVAVEMPVALLEVAVVAALPALMANLPGCWRPRPAMPNHY